jgi:DHA2 family multidrug resistance protein
VGFWDLCWPQVLQGVGFALIFVALSTAAVAELRKDQMSDATGLYNVVRRVFGSAGVALAATELDNGGIRYRAIMARHLSSARGPVSSFIQNAEHAFRQLGGGTQLAYRRSYRMLDGIMAQQGSMLSFNHVFFLMAIVFAVAIPLIFFLHSGPRDGSDVMME